MRACRKLCLALCVGGLLLPADCGKHPQPPAAPSNGHAAGPRPDIVLISIDTLRPDHLGCYGYARDTSPNIDRLASEGTLFETAISSSSWTLPAHAALFTGLADSVHGAVETDRVLAADRKTLAERLRAAGYRTVGFFSGPTLYPAFGLGQGFDTYVDCTSYPELSAAAAQRAGIEIGSPLQMASMEDVTSERIYAGVQSWLNENAGDPAAASAPFFLFIHMWDPHFDFIPPPPYDTRFDPDYTGSATGRNFIFDKTVCAAMPKRDLEHIIALYDGEIAWTDLHVGKILADLAAGGRRASTLVVLLSDHGTEFFEHQSKGHRQTLFDEVIRIPLIVCWPGHVPAGRRIADQVRIIDVLPTIMQLAGLPPPDDVMGQSLVPLLNGAPLAGDTLAVSELYSLGRAFRAFRRPDRKLIRHELSGTSIVFNLRADPGEQRPVQDPTNILFQAALKDARRGDGWLAEFRDRLPISPAAPLLPDRVRQRLENLGYIERQEKDQADKP